MGNHLAVGTRLEAFHGSTRLQRLVLHLSPHQAPVDTADLLRALPNVRELELSFHAGQLLDIVPEGLPVCASLTHLCLHADLDPADTHDVVQIVGAGLPTLRSIQLCLTGARGGVAPPAPPPMSRRSNDLPTLSLLCDALVHPRRFSHQGNPRAPGSRASSPSTSGTSCPTGRRPPPPSCGAPVAGCHGCAP